jgi:hypothetical protein
MDKVYVENAWYDGPRQGIADFNGKPHRFIANFDELTGYKDTFRLYPIQSEELQLEIEQWSIFVEWNRKYENGEVQVDTHPGHGNINQRYDEIETILKDKRESIPSDYIEAKADFEPIYQQNRYEEQGPCYKVKWKPIHA